MTSPIYHSHHNFWGEINRHNRYSLSDSRR